MPTGAFPREKHHRQSLKSRELENAAYSIAVSAYAEAFGEGAALFDEAHRHTAGFRNIDSKTLQQNQRIVTILRHLMRPYIAQDRLGQLAGLPKGAIQRIEAAGFADREDLEAVAEVIKHYLDRERIPWLVSAPGQAEERQAYPWVRGWTASSFANITSRKTQRMATSGVQEDAMAQAIARAGWREDPAASGLVAKHSDVPLGRFTRERLVKCATPPNKKADSVTRLDPGRLLLIEAKHNIDELNARKRIAEVRDKATKWRASLGPTALVVGAVLSGYFPEDELESLWSDDILIFWKHDLAELTEWLRQNGSAGQAPVPFR